VGDDVEAVPGHTVHRQPGDAVGAWILAPAMRDATRAFRLGSPVRRAASAMPVWKNVGQRTLTPTPAAASSPRSASKSATTPAFVTLYGAIPGADTSPAADATFRTWPDPCWRRRGAKTWQPWTTRQRLTRITHSQSAIGTSPTSPPTATPALLTTRWMPPSRCSVSAASRSTSARTPTSQATACASVPPRAATVARAASRSTSLATRRPPRRAISTQRARPRPRRRPSRPRGDAPQDPCRGAI
jgi:hypothetical protein